MTYIPDGTRVIDADTRAVVETWSSTSTAIRRAAELNQDNFEFTPSDKASDYLVVEDPKKKTTWHLQVKVNGKPDHKLMGAAKAALTSPGGYRGQKYSGPNKSEALAKLKKMYESENMEFGSEVVYLLDQFVATKAGEPFRLFGFGIIHKNGVEHTITPDFARQFRLPHFKPPIKLGSHTDTTPAGGQIVGLEVRSDGLYARPEYNENGARAIDEGHYRYQSPEVIWGDQGLEDPATGEMIPGPLIVGDALLHTPHLGEAAAMYSIEPFTTGGHMAQVMTDENISVPRSWLERFFGIQPKPAAASTTGSAKTDPPENPPPVVAESEEYKAAVRERDDLKAKVAAMEAETKRKNQLTAIVKDLQQAEKFGSVYINVTAAEETAAMLASMTDEQRAWCMKNFSAFIHQICESRLTGEIGATGMAGGAGTTDGTAAAAFNSAVLARMKKDKTTYEQAYSATKSDNPDLFEAYVKERE